MEIANDFRYQKRLQHLFSDLHKKIVLSGNSGILLSQIKYEISDIQKDYVIGYRERKNERKNHKYAIKKLIKEHETILEPKNYQYNLFYRELSPNLSNEEKANEVVSQAFKKYMKVIGKKI